MPTPTSTITFHGIKSPRNASAPSVRMNGATLVDPLRIVWAHDVKSPRSIADIPNVMISGFTLNTATPTPLSAPTIKPTSKPRPIATAAPSLGRLIPGEVRAPRCSHCHQKIDAGGKHAKRLPPRHYGERRGDQQR